MQQFVMAYNYGNGTIKATLHQYGKEIYTNIIPSYQVSGTEEQQTRQRQANALLASEPQQQATSTPFDRADYILDFKGRKTYHGYLALGSRQATARTGDISRYWSDDALCGFLNIAASVIGVDEAELYILANLPGDSATEENKQKVIDCLQGDHQFTHIVNGVASKKHFVVTVMGVLMEGMGVIATYGVKNALNAAIEGGQFTHNLVVANGMTVNIEMCMSIPVGVARIGEIMNNQISESKIYKGRTFSNAELHRILMAVVDLNQESEFPVLWYNGELIPEQAIRAFYEAAKVAAYNEIAPEISTKWRSDLQGAVGSSFAKIIYVGGASYHLNTLIKQRLLRKVELPASPELADVRAVAILADRLFARKYV